MEIGVWSRLRVWDLKRRSVGEGYSSGKDWGRG